MRRLLHALITPNRSGLSAPRVRRVVFLLLIVIFIYDWWQPMGVFDAILTPRVSPPPAIGFVDLCVALAGMNATVGAIVVVFVVLAIQELRVLRIDSKGQQVESARVRRDKSRLDMLLGVAILSFVILMLVAVVMLFMLLTDLLDAKNIVSIGLAGFSYGLASIAIAIYSYRILESPFVKVTSPPTPLKVQR